MDKIAERVARSFIARGTSDDEIRQMAEYAAKMLRGDVKKKGKELYYVTGRNFRGEYQIEFGPFNARANEWELTVDEKELLDRVTRNVRNYPLFLDEK